MEICQMMAEGWIFQIGLEKNRVELFFKTVQGETIVLKDNFYPWIIIVPKGKLATILSLVENHPFVQYAKVEEKFVSIFDDRKSKVIKVFLNSTDSVRRFLKDIEKIEEIKEINETKLPNFLKYMMERKVRFFQKVKVEYDNSDQILQVFSSEQEEPKINAVSLDIKITEDEKIESISVCGRNFYKKYYSQNENELLNSFIKDFKKMENFFEVLITYAGDKFLGLLNQKLVFYSLEKLPLIYSSGIEYRGKIHLDIAQDIGRDFSIEYLFSDELEDICEYFFGKYDEEKKSRYILEIGLRRLIGLIELSNICNSKPGLVSRTTPGMLNTFVHYETAYNEDYVIPDKKKIIESIKTLKELMELDKSGMIYYPEPGVYFKVAKLDFSSLYPSIIVKHNISAETVFCNHDCGEICKLKKGIVPKGLKKVLERRLLLKKKMKETDGEEREVLDIKQKSLKTLLVTCFGYMGYS